jgi:hypothetical protein
MRHPDSGWLMDYACGHLSPAFDIVIATHLLGCARMPRVTSNSPRGWPPRSWSTTAHSSRGWRPMTYWLGSSPWGAGHAGLAAEQWRDGRGARPGCGGGQLPRRSASRRCAGAASAAAWRWPSCAVARATACGCCARVPARCCRATVISGSELTVVLQGAYMIDDQLFSVGDLEDADESVRPTSR